MKTYYLHLKFVNYGARAAIVDWVDPAGKQRTVEVNSGSLEDRTIFTTTQTPAGVDITAVDKATNKQLTLNSLNRLTVAPSETANLVTINIGEGIAASVPSATYTRDLV